MGEVDEPSDILDGAILAQKQLLSGFGGNPEVDKKKLQEAKSPKHCAISLAGEPMIYPKISDFIQECRKRGMTTFLVTNGLHPDILEEVAEPTQLYISVVAPDHRIYEAICQPQVDDGWGRLNQSLELMPSFKCRKVIRLTLVKGLNLEEAPGYAGLINRAEPDFIETKAYMHVGFARARLKIESMPRLAEIKAFSQDLARETGYEIVDESEPSRVVLLKK